MAGGPPPAREPEESAPTARPSPRLSRPPPSTRIAVASDRPQVRNVETDRPQVIAAGTGCQRQIRAAGYGLRAAGSRLRGYRLPGYRLRARASDWWLLATTGYGPRAPGLRVSLC